MERLSLHENKVVVAVDFGTTYSGVAWAKIGDVCRETLIKWAFFLNSMRRPIPH